MLPHPTLDAPPPLRGSDPDSFAHYTVTTRLPDLLERTMREGDFPPSAQAHLRALGEEIPYGLIRGIDDPQAPDGRDWEAYIAEMRGLNWLEVPWFFAETYFYRRILEATGYFGRPCPGTDPFAPQKTLSREADAAAISALAERATAASRDPDPSALSAALTTALWGNQADLSMWPDDADRPDAGRDGTGNDSDARILADDRQQCAQWICERAPLSRVDVVLDNTGVELVSDLALAGYLLDTDLAETVVLHAKSHPTFISDATQSDVDHQIDELSGGASDAAQHLGRRLHDFLDAGRLLLAAPLFWTSPLPGWGLPDALYETLSKSDLLVSKGDANYRRWLGDRHWRPLTSFDAVVDYAPAPLLALRTMKSEVVVGLSSDAVARAREEDSEWRVSGEYGLVQFAATPSGREMRAPKLETASSASGEA